METKEKANRTGKRRDSAPVDGVDYLEIKRAGELTDAQLKALEPFFNELAAIIHQKWENCLLSDGATAKMLHFQLRAVNELQRVMKRSVTQGKKATHKLEETNRA